MGTRTGYQPGTFSWVDLGTTDPEDAKRFYSALLGWAFEESEVPGGGVYAIATVGDESVAAIHARSDRHRDAGVPAVWSSFVTVASADETAGLVAALGGAVHVEPFDVAGAGRMAVISDPTGAELHVWESGQVVGAGRVNEPGCLTSNELVTDDVEAASGFYSRLFGWRIQEIDTGDGPRYWTIVHDGAAAGKNGGVRELSPAEAGLPPYWLPYFATASVDETLAEAERLGGHLLAGPIEVPSGRFAGIRDPQGAVFEVAEGEFDD